jgi:hypothetical protein
MAHREAVALNGSHRIESDRMALPPRPLGGMMPNGCLEKSRTRLTPDLDNGFLMDARVQWRRAG